MLKIHDGLLRGYLGLVLAALQLFIPTQNQAASIKTGHIPYSFSQNQKLKTLPPPPPPYPFTLNSASAKSNFLQQLESSINRIPFTLVNSCYASQDDRIWDQYKSTIQTWLANSQSQSPQLLKVAAPFMNLIDQPPPKDHEALSKEYTKILEHIQSPQKLIDDSKKYEKSLKSTDDNKIKQSYEEMVRTYHDTLAQDPAYASSPILKDLEETADKIGEAVTPSEKKQASRLYQSFLQSLENSIQQKSSLTKNALQDLLDDLAEIQAKLKTPTALDHCGDTQEKKDHHSHSKLLEEWDPNSPECQDWLDAHLLACGAEEYEVAKALLESVRFSKFKDYKAKLDSEASKVLETIPKDQPITILTSPGKSSQWLYENLSPDLFQGRPAPKVVELDLQKDEIKIPPETFKNVFIFDDGIHSGDQMGKTNKKIQKAFQNLPLEQRPTDPNFHIFVHEHTEKGKQHVLNQTNPLVKVSVHGNSMPSLKDLLSKKPAQMGTLKQMYKFSDKFDPEAASTSFYSHKVPDGVSTIEEFFREGKVKCKNHQEVRCNSADPSSALSYECIPWITPPYKSSAGYTNLGASCRENGFKPEHCKKLKESRQKLWRGECLASSFDPVAPSGSTSVELQRAIDVAAKHGRTRARNLLQNHLLKSHPWIVQKPNYSNLCMIKEHLLEDLKNGLNPHEALLVLDVDDTLVMRGKPLKPDGDYLDEPKTGYLGTPTAVAQFVERPCAYELVKIAKENNIPLSISSAHHRFDETMMKLDQIGIKKLLGLGDSSTTGTFKLTPSDPTKTFEYVKNGPVVSVRKTGDKEYRDKFAATAHLLTPDKRKDIRKIYLVDDSNENHTKFEDDVSQFKQTYFPNLKALDLHLLTKTKLSTHERGFLSAARTKNEDVRDLFQYTYSKIAPTLIKAVDELLMRSRTDGSSAELIFLARDGISGWEIAKKLLERFPERYQPIQETQLHYLQLNKDTLGTAEPETDLAVKYLEQNKVSRGKRAYFFDIGWGASTLDRLKSRVEGTGATFRELALVFTHNERPEVKGFINFKLNTQPFEGVSGNEAVHFMEDTFAGIKKRCGKLIQDSTGTILGEHEGEDDPLLTNDELVKNKRFHALEAIQTSAADITLDELNTLNSGIAQNLIFPFLQDLKDGKNDHTGKNLKRLMVPHQK